MERGFAVTATTRDPIRQSDLKAAGCRVATLDVTDEAALKEIDRHTKSAVTEAAEYAQQSPEPDPGELYTDVLVDA